MVERVWASVRLAPTHTHAARFQLVELDYIAVRFLVWGELLCAMAFASSRCNVGGLCVGETR